MKYPVCEEHERWGGGGGRRRGEWRERKERRRKEGEWRKEGEKEKGRGWKERRRKEGGWRERKGSGEKGRREGERKGSGENGKKEDVGEEKENVHVCTCVKWGGVCGGGCETKTTQYLGVWLTGG